MTNFFNTALDHWAGMNKNAISMLSDSVFRRNAEVILDAQVQASRAVFEAFSLASTTITEQVFSIKSASSRK
jgi:hypothetical protein